MNPLRRLSLRSAIFGASAVCGLLVATAVVASARDDAPTRSGAGLSSASGERLRDVLAVFSRPASGAGVLPSEQVGDAQAVIAQAPSHDVDPGSLDLEYIHVLIAGAGDKKPRLVAVPTSKGNVCLFLNEAFTGCAGVENFRDAPVDISVRDVDELGAGSPVVVYGLALNDVTRVSIVDDKGTTQPAVLANNGFFAELADARAWPAAVEVTRADGSLLKLELPGPPNPTS